MTDRPEYFSLSSCRPPTIPCRFCSSEHKLRGTGLMPALAEKRPPADSKVLVPGIISSHFTAVSDMKLILCVLRKEIWEQEW